MARRKLVKKRRKKKNTDVEDQKANSPLKNKVNNGQGAVFKSQTMLAIPGIPDNEGGAAKQKVKKEAASKDMQANALLAQIKNVPPTMLQVSGKGQPAQDSAKGTTVRLEGRTDADFDGGSFETQNVRVSRAEHCDSCAEGDTRIRARGTLVARYHVTTTVTLPSASDFPDLTECQQQRVQHGIDTILAPHEQEHVDAFRQYNGVTRTPFDLVLCRSEFNSTIRDMFDRQEASRRASAQAASDALDPFYFDVDIDCEEPPEEDSSTNTSNEKSSAEDTKQAAIADEDSEQNLTQKEAETS